MKKISILNAKFSPNLGDGILAECIEKGLVECGFVDTEINTIDVAARTEYQYRNLARSSILNALQCLPKWLRSNLIKIPLNFFLVTKWLPYYKKMIKNSDVLIIGGGNLFTDFDLNFPTKLSAMINLATELHIPIFIYGVGVGKKWSSEGKLQLKNALENADIKYVSARDLESKIMFDTLFAQAAKNKAIIVNDPGLLAHKYLINNNYVIKANKPLIGLCITSSIAISYHSNITISKSFLLNWYADLYKQLHISGFQVAIFTNGSSEDVEMANCFMAEIKNLSAPSLLLIQPNYPSELANFISNLSVLIAHRMHALITAYACGIDIVALKWEDKIESFMFSVGLQNQLFSTQDTSPEEVLTLVKNLTIRRLNSRQIPTDITESFSDLKNLADCLHNLS